ncbi:MAG: glycosyltransferase family protein [Sphingobacteriales bacterium]|nr:glycosyltransferase family protein [Sphingobacteriales bacterium]
MPRIAIITQARTTSTRLPAKVLLTAAHQTMLAYHINRAQQSGYPVLVATTTNYTDQAIADFCAQYQIACYRGSEQHVLSRYYECALQHQVDIVVRVTSDCPLIDGSLIAQGIDQFLAMNNSYAYVSNGVVRSFPRGFDLEVFSFQYLEEAYQNATLASDIEHVTPYIHQNRSGKTIFSHLCHTEDKSQYRITLDTPEDYELLRLLIEQYSAHTLNYAQIIKLLDEHPELVAINAHIEQKKL